MSSLTYRGSFILNDGYGRVSNNLVLELLARGWDIYLGDINEEKYTKARAHPLIANNYDKLFVHSNTEFQINHFPPTHFPPRVSSLTKTVLYTTFETTQPPIEWKDRIERTSRALLVTSEWVKGIFREALDVQVPIHVLYHGFDQPAFSPAQIGAKWENPNPLRFLMVAANPFDNRKNGWFALKAFQNAFPNRDDKSVEFWICGHGMPNIYTEDDRILFFRGDLSDSALHKLYQMCHLLVSPSRGEGFGLPIFEAMHFGMVPIVTDWSTPGDLLTEEIAFKIPVKRLVPVTKGGDNPFKHVFFGKTNSLGEWADPSFGALIHIMKECSLNREYLLGRAWEASQFVTQFTIPNSVDDLERILGEL